MQNNVRKALLISWSSLFVLPTVSAFAQANPVGEAKLETVLVMGTRQPYRGQFDFLDTPQAELSIDAQTLRNAGATDLNQALDLSASVARQNNFGGLWNSFAVRGFVGDGNLPSNYLVNGFNAGRGFGGARDLSGIDSVEVLKGPRAALFGRGEPGGTINLVTKRPTFETAGELRLSAARFDRYRADADWTTPLNEHLAIRLVGHYEDAHSFRDTVETQQYGASPSLLWRLSERTQLVYELEYSHQELPFDRGVLAINGELGLIPPSRFLGEPGDQAMEADVLGHQFNLQHDFNDDWSALIGVNYRNTSLEGFSTEAELTASRQQLFIDSENLTRQRRFRDYDATYKVLRGEISGHFTAAGFAHRIILGVDADEFDNDQVFLRARAPSLASNPTPEQLQLINIFRPSYGQFPLPVPSPLTDRVETQRSVGLFVQDQIQLTERLQIRLGARHDDYDQKLENRAADNITRQSETRLSPQSGVVLQVTESMAVYATYGENFRPLSGADFDGKSFAPNQSTALEAGVKFDLADGALTATASLFEVEQDNMLVSDPTNAGFSVAAGKARSQGFEFDVSGDIMEGLSLWFSYAFVDAQMRNAVLDPDFGKSIQAGDRLLNVPKHSLTLQVAKQLQLDGRPLSIGGGAIYTGRRLGEVGTDFELPDYTLVRVFTTYELTEAITLRAEVDNLFDETYYSNSYSQLWVQPGTPRSVRVSAAFRF